MREKCLEHLWVIQRYLGNYPRTPPTHHPLPGGGWMWGTPSFWESRFFESHNFGPHFQDLDACRRSFCTLNLTRVYHFIQILLGPISNLNWRTPPDFTQSALPYLLMYSSSSLMLSRRGHYVSMMFVCFDWFPRNFHFYVLECFISCAGHHTDLCGFCFAYNFCGPISFLIHLVSVAPLTITNINSE